MSDNTNEFLMTDILFSTIGTAIPSDLIKAVVPLMLELSEQVEAASNKVKETKNLDDFTTAVIKAREEFSEKLSKVATPRMETLCTLATMEISSVCSMNDEQMLDIVEDMFSGTGNATVH